jgi:hypothetical protein
MSAPAVPAPVILPAADREPFVATLRSRPTIVRIGTGAEPHITIRVQVPEVWDVVRIEAPSSTSVRTIKTQALEVLYPDAGDPDALVMKLNGAEVRDESAAIEDVGAKDGSTFLLTFRRRRPVKS